MLTVILVIVVVAIIAVIVSSVRAFTLKPSETLLPNSTLAYPAEHWQSQQVYNKKYAKNQLILKISLTLSVIGGIVLFILKSI